MATQSVEPKVADRVNDWLRSYKVDYKLEQESASPSIDNALRNYPSKNGGTGGNRPDAQMLMCCKDGKLVPVMIEYKGKKDALVKLNADSLVENTDDKGNFLFKHINDYAVNGAVHYANAIIANTDYREIIAIGVTGYDDAQGKLQTQVGVYYVSTSNMGFGQKVGDYSDLSFLRGDNFEEFMQSVRDLSLTADERDSARRLRDIEIDAHLMALNNEVYNQHPDMSPEGRMYMVIASILATYPHEGIPPVETHDLLSLDTDPSVYDGRRLLTRIEAFVNKRHLPQAKKQYVINQMTNLLTDDKLNERKKDESTIKEIFAKVVKELGLYYKGDVTTDFTGKLFNEMFRWAAYIQNLTGPNNIVLTPPYVATLLARLARVDKDSYVWDFATGSAGLLVAAMNEMIKDATLTIASHDERKQKIMHIKAKQLLGIEIVPEVCMLAILNMILMGDGSSNIIQKDSLTDFDGDYDYNGTGKFPATAFVLNPPYIAEGCGMVFVDKALSMMDKGYAAFIIQSSAGSGKAKDFNCHILERNTLLASIKMPDDLFLGKAAVQTRIYVLRVGEKHDPRTTVRFIDFTNDGYTRTNRKKARRNLFDTDNATERYAEVVNLVHFGRESLHHISEADYYEGHIDPTNGTDWNQTAPRDTRPTLADFKKTIADYLAWEVSNLIKTEDESLGK